MKWIRSAIIIVMLIPVIDSCIKQPEYPNAPQIQLQSLTFKRGSLINGEPAPDSIIFVLKFNDGDGNLGLDPNETAIYLAQADSIDIHPNFYFVYDTIANKILGYLDDLNADLTQYGSNLSYVDYKAKRKLSSITPFDTLPNLSCSSYIYDNNGDTIYFYSNPNTYNFFADAYLNGSQTAYKTTQQFSSGCTGTPFLHGRFPILSSDPGINNPLDGTITYKYRSFGLAPFYGAKVKFRIYITDRTFIPSTIGSSFQTGYFQRSNVIITKDYQF